MYKNKKLKTKSVTDKNSGNALFSFYKMVVSGQVKAHWGRRFSIAPSVI
ncbi:hypothetical protein HMPREF0454_04333 [Hafnia alvei ATCC 51873]|uniref:Uncharacterized protein n=1 Tax=Hafnia alvei ATCC 51873 TaxID=1002364 RepID=G9YCJ5_HAFAL|nr:hypothetical protein HMPREF0454_04333 [Hafnia alvei ATCC 51873]